MGSQDQLVETSAGGVRTLQAAINTVRVPNFRFLPNALLWGPDFWGIPS